MPDIRTTHLLTMTLAVSGMQAIGATPSGNRRIGLVAGGGGVWYFKVRSLQKSVITMTGEYRTAEKGRKDLEEQSKQHPIPVTS